LFEHGPGTASYQRDQAGCGLLIQPLSHALSRGEAADTQRLLEILVVAHGGDGLKITLAQAQQPQGAAHNVDFGDLAAAPDQAAHLPPQVTGVVDAGADQWQAGVAGGEFVVALLEDQSLHVCTCQVSFWDRRILINFIRNFNVLIVLLTTSY
jgi:hypothetical protein